MLRLFDIIEVGYRLFFCSDYGQINAVVWFIVQLYTAMLDHDQDHDLACSFHDLTFTMFFSFFRSLLGDPNAEEHSGVSNLTAFFAFLT